MGEKYIHRRTQAIAEYKEGANQYYVTLDNFSCGYWSSIWIENSNDWDFVLENVVLIEKYEL